MRQFWAAFLIGVALSTPAKAREWPKTAGWDIVQSESSCAIFEEYEGKGETNLLIVLNVDGSAGAMMTNYGWSAADDENYELSWIVNGSVYTGPAFGIGKRYETRKGFGGKFRAEFIDDIAKGSSLLVQRGDIVVDQLSLDGSGAAIAMAKRCLAVVKAEIAAAERERQRFAHIADDPFAGEPTKAETDFGVALRPLNRGALFTNADYPAQAMREEREGRTSYRLTIGANGTPTACDITVSSGHADLDAETCSVLMGRARFPMIDPNGDTRFYENSVRWQIP